MKKSILAALSFAAVLSLGFSSCNRTNQETPVNPGDSPNQETPVNPGDSPNQEIALPDKISIEMHAGHLHGTSFHGNPSFLNTDFPDKGVQKIDFKLNADGKTFSVAGGNNPVRWKAHVIWSMETVCYDKAGKRINNMFVKDGAEDLYQLFITVDNFRKYTPGSKEPGAAVNTTFEKVGTGFVYRDTDPEDHMFGHHHHEVKLSGKQLGLKGYFDNAATAKEAVPFNGLREKHLSYDLHLRMVRFATPDAKKANGAYRSAFAWEEGFAALSVMEVVIPIRVVTMTPSDDPETEKEYLKDLAAEYGLTLEQIEKLYEDSWDVPMEGEGAEHYHM